MKTSSLLKYSGEYKNLIDNFDSVRTEEDASKHPLLNGIKLDEFYFSVIKDISKIPYKGFYNIGATRTENVPKRKIIGTSHSAYCGITWLSALTVLQRGRCKNEEQIAALIPIEKQKECYSRIRMVLYNGEYYIVDGNNRVIQAQFADNITEIPCEVTEFVFDEHRYNIAETLNNLNCRIDCAENKCLNDIVIVNYENFILKSKFNEVGNSFIADTIQQAMSLSKHYILLRIYSLFNIKYQRSLCFDVFNKRERRLAVIAIAYKLHILKINPPSMS